MNNSILQLKFKQRLNKLDSHDYDNIEPWQMAEAFNKAQLNWCRRQIHGYNYFKEGDEGSKIRKDDLQILLKEKKMRSEKKKLYYETEQLPSDYFQYKRVSCNANSDLCEKKRGMVVYLAEEANVNELLRDVNRNPNFAWGETFCTLIGNKVRLYTNDEFEIDDIMLTYYRFPVYVQFKGFVNPYTGKIAESDIECEFKDDVTELIIDEAVKIISGDIELLNVNKLKQTEVETNN